MQNIILFDDSIIWCKLLPLTYTRPVADIRIGILKIFEKWQKHFNVSESSYITKSYLSKKYSVKFANDNYLINSSVLPNLQLVKEIFALKTGEALINGSTIIAAKADKQNAIIFSKDLNFQNFNFIKCVSDYLYVNNLWDIFSKNKLAFDLDFDLITSGRESEALPKNNIKIGEGNLFIEAGAKIYASIFNTSEGDIYIGKESEIMEGCTIRGPFAACHNSTLKMQTKVYGATTVGPFSKCGGELNNVVIFGFSNKAHDGFLGNSVIGEWCNLGADTNNSNLKNNYAAVKIWSYAQEKFIHTELQFCGLFMADHAKCGINTMFNTGTVVGVGANVFGSGFPRNFIPSFSWGGAQGLSTFEINKAFEVAEKVMERRQLNLNETEKEILNEVYFKDEKYRK